MTKAERNDKWQGFIDQLYKWYNYPSQLDEENTITPSMDTIFCACNIAASLNFGGHEPPNRIVPSAHGEIVFEREANGIFETVRISATKLDNSPIGPLDTKGR